MKEEKSYRKTFPKSIRLKSVKDIDALFRHRFFLTQGHFRLYFLDRDISDDKPSAQYLVNVSKKNFSHSVDRNLIKRKMREAIRLNKSDLEAHIALNPSKRHIFGVTYLGKKIPDFDYAQKCIIQLFRTWIDRYENAPKNSHLPAPTAD